MRAIRSLLAAIALALLVCQGLAAAAPPVMACAAAANAAEQEIVCTCVHAPGAECPMHKKSKKPHRTPPASRDTRCCADTTPEQTGVVTVLDVLAGLPEERQILVTSVRDIAAPSPHDFPTRDLASPPTSPPPELSTPA